MHEWASLWPAKISVACICQMVTCTIETSDIHLNLSLLLPYVQIFHVSLYIYIYAMHLSLSNHCGLRGILLVSLKVFKLVKIHVTSCRKRSSPRIYMYQFLLCSEHTIMSSLNDIGLLCDIWYPKLWLPDVLAPALDMVMELNNLARRQTCI